MAPLPRKAARAALAILLVAAVALAWRNRAAFTREAVESYLRGLGRWGPVVFLGIYTVAPALLFPGSVLTVAAGAMFGAVAGTLLSLVGATAGATVAFLLARYLRSEGVERGGGGEVREVKGG